MPHLDIDVFLSYARADFETAQFVRGRLLEQNLKVWWDQAIAVSDNWSNAIQEALAAAKVVLVLWSSNSVLSEPVQAEALYALRNHKLAQARFGSCSLPYAVSMSQFADLSNWNGEPSQQWQKLLSAIRNISAKTVQINNQALPILCDIQPGICRVPYGSGAIDVSVPHSFGISRFPITSRQFAVFTEATGHTKPDDEGWHADVPVVNVNVDDAQKYCEWLSNKALDMYRLPSEIEWQLACSMGELSRFPWGNDYVPGSCNAGHSDDGCTSMGKYKANRNGIYDMIGNVWEWCADPWNECLGTVAFDSYPLGTGDRARHTAKGGAWNTELADLSAFSRRPFRRGFRLHSLGFRVVRLCKQVGRY
jgi:formylglycine-generating enzyme